MELFDAHDVSFVSVTQSFNTTSSMGRLTLNVLLSFAQFEREVIGERVREAVTEPVLVAGAHENVVEEVTVGPPDTAVRLRVPTRAKVTVTIVQAPVEWVVADVPVRLRGSASAVKSAPDRVTVQLRGPRELVTTKVSDFEATIDITGLGPGQVLVPVRVTAPERIGVVRVEPSEVRVRIP